MIDSLLQDILATSATEWLAVLLGFIYVVLIVRRNQYGWIAGGASALIYVYLSAQARLPMQSLLQAFYVVMAVYGWWAWRRSSRSEAGGGLIGRWPWRRHVLALAGVVVLSIASARWLALETHAAWPWLDSFTTWISLLATWLTARMKLENWLYWIAIDALTTFLFAAQDHVLTAGLYLSYLLIAVIGWREWRRTLRLQA